VSRLSIPGAMQAKHGHVGRRYLIYDTRESIFRVEYSSPGIGPKQAGLAELGRIGSIDLIGHLRFCSAVR
jgi:hypothetical protein